MQGSASARSHAGGAGDARLRFPDRRTSFGCCVRASKTWNCASKQHTTNLFMGMSLRSNCTPHTPFCTLASQRTCSSTCIMAAQASWQCRHHGSTCIMAAQASWQCRHHGSTCIMVAHASWQCRHHSSLVGSSPYKAIEQRERVLWQQLLQTD